MSQLTTELSLEDLNICESSDVSTKTINLNKIPINGQGKHLFIIEGRVLAMKDCEIILRLQKYSGGHMFLWVGDESKYKMIKNDCSIPSNLCLAIGSNATAILSDCESNCHLSSTSLASKLSIKFNDGKPFYISLNVPQVAPYLVDKLSMGITQAIKQFMSQAVQASLGDA